jgi:hypothetical protein
LVQAEATQLSGFFLKKKPPSSTIEKSTCIPKMLYLNCLTISMM